MAAGAGVIVARERRRTGKPAPWLEGAPSELGRNPRSYVFNNGAVGVELFRDGRGAAFVMGAERGGGGHRPHPSSARSPAGARTFLLRVGGGRGALVDRLRARTPRRRLPHRGARLPTPRDRARAERDRSPDGDRARRRAGGRAELEGSPDRPLRDGAPGAAHQLLRGRRARDGRIRARPRFRRHARRDGFRPRAERDPRPQPAAALRPRGPGRDGVLRRQARGRRRARRLRGLRARASSAKARSPAPPAASAGGGASSTTRASSGPSTPRRAFPWR